MPNRSASRLKLPEFAVELMNPPINHRATPMSIMKNPSSDRPFISPTVGAVPPVESDELSRFEGEGGPAVPSLERGDIPKRLRRLKRNELVTRGDFVADERRGFEAWDGPSGFRADSFVKPIFRRDRSGSTATEELLETTRSTNSQKPL
jgi:hypothetical protein